MNTVFIVTKYNCGGLFISQSKFYSNLNNMCMHILKFMILVF